MSDEIKILNIEGKTNSVDISVKTIENPVINLEITTYTDETGVTFIQSKGDKGDKGDTGIPYNFKGTHEEYLSARASGAIISGMVCYITDDSSIIDTTSFVTADSLNTKVDKITGKNLSTNDLTDTLKTHYDTAYTNNHTHSNSTALNNVSGSNTGDETNSSIKTKLGTDLSNPTFTSINISAGTSSTAPINLTSGQLLTSSLSGANEFANNTFYKTPNNANRAVVPVRHFYSNTTSYGLTNGTSAQSIFGKSISLPATTTYRFRARYHIGTGATTHTSAHGFAITNALISCEYLARLSSNALNTTSTNFNCVWISSASAKILNAASTAVTTLIELEGIIRTNLATTITPQITFSAAPGTTCQTYAGSFIEFEPIGTSTDISCGAWS